MSSWANSHHTLSNHMKVQTWIQQELKLVNFIMIIKLSTFKFYFSISMHDLIIKWNMLKAMVLYKILKWCTGRSNYTYIHEQVQIANLYGDIYVSTLR